MLLLSSLKRGAVLLLVIAKLLGGGVVLEVWEKSVFIHMMISSR